MLRLIAAEVAPQGAVLRCLTLLVASATLCLCQTRTDQETPAHVQFEVASVRVNHSGALEFNTSMSAGRFIATNVPLRRLIRDAYQVRVFQIENLPSWDPGQRFDISAKMPAASRMADLIPMLQDLLATRLGLVLRREMKEAPVFALVVDKNGPKLGERIAEATTADRRFMLSPGAIKGNATMTQLALYLGADLETMVTDKTGVDGVYAIDLKFLPESTATGPLPPTAGDFTIPSIFEAVGSLGLRLERQKGMVLYYYVEHVLKVPTEN